MARPVHIWDKLNEVAGGIYTALAKIPARHVHEQAPRRSEAWFVWRWSHREDLLPFEDKRWTCYNGRILQDRGPIG